MRHLSLLNEHRPPGDRQSRLCRQAARLAALGGWECDLANDELAWTDAVYDMFGLSIGARLKRSDILSLYSDRARMDVDYLRSRAVRSHQGFTLDAELRLGRGESRWIRITAAIAQEGGRAVRIFGAKQDVTLQHETIERLRHLSECDALTGLANRRFFDALFASLIAKADFDTSMAALVLIDIDHFKQINDRFGHAAGDECLRSVASRLRVLLEDALLIARIGGDEFAILLPFPKPPLAIARLLKKTSKELSRPFLWNGQMIDMRASIGARLLIHPRLPRPETLFIEADEALYAAKAAGRNRIELFGITQDPFPASTPPNQTDVDEWEVGQRPARSR